MRTYNLFISHSWRHGDHYDRLVKLLRNRSYFRFKDYSVPRHDPLGSRSQTALRAAIRRQMSPCHVVIIMAGVYATHSNWINEEIDLAVDEFGRKKPIIAVKPRGNVRVSVPVRQAADRIVGWNTESIVSAIRDLA